MFPVCPKCRHQLGAAAGATACPACGLVFAKFVAAQSGAPARIASVEHDDAAEPGESGFVGRLFEVPAKVESWQVYARIAFYLFLFVWGWRLAAMDIRDGEMGGSFMHLVNLAFHEAGHMIFMPFGEFMHIAGGTLGQLAMPIIAGVALHWKTRDNFGASCALWWLAVSFMDCAPYAWDALHPQLVLLSGRTGEDGPHDWIDMLGDLGLLRQAHTVGRLLHVIGIALMLAANAWGAAVLYRQFRNRTDAPVLD